jgi:hypothetical protein
LNLQNSRWTHYRNQYVYKVVAYKGYFIEATNEPAIVYTREDGKDKRRWIRPLAEFMDGRFKRILDNNEKEEHPTE